MERIPGIRDVSGFFSHFGAEDVVLRPATAERAPFQIEVLLNGNEATFAPSAPVYEGDVVERADPRGGVIEYVVDEYEINRDPFGGGDDHGVARLRERGRASRHFASANVVISGGTNQVAIGDSNRLSQSNRNDAGEIAAALARVLADIPGEAFTPDEIAELHDAINEATAAESESKPASTVRRTLHAVRGVVEHLAGSAKDGAGDAVKDWSKGGVAAIIALLAGLH